MLKNRLTKEESLLMFAGAFTWALVTWVTILNSQGTARLASAGLCGLFLLLFLLIASDILPRMSGSLSKQALMLLAASALGLMFMDNSLSPILLVVWATLLPEFYSRRRALGLLLLVNVGYFAIIYGYWHSQDAWLTILIFIGFQLFALSSSLARCNERAARVQQERLNQQLLATRSLLSQTSQQQERLRIARDLHDILGHQLTALTLQLEVLSHKAPSELQAQVQQSKELAKQLLQDIRAVVRAQRLQSHLALRPPLNALMSRLPGVSLHCDELVPLQSTELAQELLLVLQEGISNAVRHGHATQLQLTLQRKQDTLQLLLTDNGRGLNPSQEAGTGITGMRERLARFSGEVELLANTGQTENTRGCSLQIRVKEPQHG
ncbi:histidine kinase [Shewanella sp. AS16]|uniref:sensor histidine kinase n=1 Tax=Shewanella sp. AS16 TaxID=2907625 RepID=UPI001F19F347|nr:histidine kinase [Shewanella sp. AS16]MCE9686594.1 histidine kinase [Shewanella sp. AS16]